MLSERGMGKAVGDFVKKDDNDAIHTMVNHQIKDVSKSLNTVRITYILSIYFTFILLNLM